MPKKTKQYNIRSFEQLGDIINEKNIDIIFANLYGSAKCYLDFKKNNKQSQWLGINWIDDGKTIVKGLNISIDVEYKKNKK